MHCTGSFEVVRSYTIHFICGLLKTSMPIMNIVIWSVCVCVCVCVRVCGLLMTIMNVMNIIIVM